MLQVTIDVFSGRPNPVWLVTDETEVRRLLTEVTRNRSAIAEPGQGYQGLGFRSITLEFTDDVEAGRYSLPSQFAIASGASADEAKGQEIAEEIIRSMTQVNKEAILTPELGSFDPSLERFLLEQIGIPRAPLQTAPDMDETSAGPTQAAAVVCYIELGRFNPGFWNDSDHVRLNNNCYNYGRNWRTDTFAQPGRASGRM